MQKGNTCAENLECSEFDKSFSKLGDLDKY